MPAWQPVPQTSDQGIRTAVLEQAAQWFAVLRDEAASAQDRERWRSWISADPAHAAAWQRVESVLGTFHKTVESGGAATARATLERRTRRARRRVLGALGGAGVAVLAGLLAPRTVLWREWSAQFAAANADVHTAIGEVRDLTLADGSLLWLGTATAADVRYGDRSRLVLLHEGEVLVQSAPDVQPVARPLMVETRHGTLTARGTRFSVRSLGDSSEVAVFEGAVEVRSRGGEGRVVHAGAQVRFDAAGLDVERPASHARESWARGILLADDTPLDQFIAELARYRKGSLTCDPVLARHRLVGAYPLQDTDRILAALQATLPVRLRQTGPAAWHLEPL